MKPATDEEAIAALTGVVGGPNAEQLRRALCRLYRLHRTRLGAADAYEVTIGEFLRLGGARVEPEAGGWTAYSPAFAPHVKGSYSPREVDDETGLPEPQTVRATCERCGESYGPAECRSGRVRQHVDAWAAATHLHRDPMDPRPLMKRPGS